MPMASVKGTSVTDEIEEGEEKVSRERKMGDKERNQKKRQFQTHVLSLACLFPLKIKGDLRVREKRRKVLLMSE